MSLTCCRAWSNVGSEAVAVLARLSLVALALIVLAGCASRPVTPELTQFVPGSGYRFNPRVELPDNDAQTLLMLTFSGGGTRAAAFSYGVLEELRRTVISGGGNPHSALKEVDVITGTSGGSFTALAYAQYGERLFGMYEGAFLKRDVEGALVKRLFSPLAWQLMSPTFGRSELAAEYYDEILFNGATYGDLARQSTPVAIVGSTDVTTGARIDFSQAEFDVMCNDLSKFSVARAAAASSAVPVVLTPVTLDNHGGTCGFRPPPWVAQALKSADDIYLGNRLDLRLRKAVLLADSRHRPYIHLVDGGLADNLALGGLVDVLQEAMINRSARAAMDIGRIRRIAVIIVNAHSAPRFDFDQQPTGPGAVALLSQAVSVPMDRYSTASIEALQDMIREWNLRLQIEADARALGQRIEPADALPAIDFTVVDVSFDVVTDPGLREYLQGLPTSFVLTEEAVDRLRNSGAQVLRDSPAFQRFVHSLNPQR